MKISFKAATALAILIFALGFAKDEIIELEKYVNGRTSANFLKDTDNVKFTLAPKTQGKIQETKKFGSGNYGLKVEITSGPRKGESVWVYYRTADPGIKLYANEADAKKGVESKDVEKSKSAQTTRETPAIRDPSSAKPEKKNEAKSAEKPKARSKSEKLDKSDAEETVRRVTEANQAVQKHGKPGGPCAECDVAKVYSRDTAPEDEKKTPFVSRPSVDAGTFLPIQRTSNPNRIRSTRCGGGSIEYCTYEGDTEPGYFKFRAGNEMSGREWGFYFEGKARQDLGISISDMHNGTVSQTNESYIMVFPRKTLPSVRVEGDKQIVTLATGETVTYDKNTRKVIGGVMSEQGSKSNVAYHGNGVMVRVEARGEEPRLKAKTAVITKQGKTCKVPAKSLWPDRSENSAAHFKYFSDADFDGFLRKTCGFGL